MSYESRIRDNINTASTIAAVLAITNVVGIGAAVGQEPAIERLTCSRPSQGAVQ